MSCPRECAQKGVGGESWGEETAARKRKREVEWEGHEERGEGSAVPALGKRVEGTAVVSISCLQLTQFLCHLTLSPALHFCLTGPPPQHHDHCCCTVSCCFFPHLPSCL